jgi:hypothetical protein
MTVLTRTRREHAAVISAALVKGVESAIEAGKCLAIAQSELDRPEFLAMLHEDLHITEGTASKLKSIASHPVLSQLSHGKALPPNWSVLYALTQVPQARLISAIESGDIHPDMERKDVRALLPPPEPEQRDDDLPPDYEGSNAPAPEDGADKSPATNPLVMRWATAGPEERREFVHACWDEIVRARDQADPAKPNGNAGADHWAHLSKENAEAVDHWIESDR